LPTCLTTSRLDQLIKFVQDLDSRLSPLRSRHAEVTRTIKDLKSKQTETYKAWAGMPISEGSRHRTDLDSINFELASSEHGLAGLDQAINLLQSQKMAVGPEYAALQQAERDRLENEEIERLRLIHAEKEAYRHALDEQLGAAERATAIAHSNWRAALERKHQKEQDRVWEQKKAELNAKKRATEIQSQPSAPLAGA
jgi:hypothetical protein